MTQPTPGDIIAQYRAKIHRKFAKVDALKEKLRAAEADLDREISVYAKSRGCAFMRPEAVRFEIGKQ